MPLRLLRFCVMAFVLAGCTSYRTPHRMMRAAPSKASPARLAHPSLPAPSDEAWIAVYNDATETSSVHDMHRRSFGRIPVREAAVLRFAPGRQELSVQIGRAQASLGATLRPGCVYFARVLDARGKLELIADRRMDASEWMASSHIATPRRAEDEWTRAPEEAPSSEMNRDLELSVAPSRVDEAPEWFQAEAVCERVSSPP